MGKRLEDRGLEELWQLFPIFLVPHKKEWAGWYREEKGRLEVLLGAGLVKRVSHIGSTAISGIWAKNIIDILLEVPDKKKNGRGTGNFEK
ncbi:GrpB family protein [Dialister invisus]|uniref:GrpB family protein n=1 Tax=Dialister invisus TaxID=218538 RepID=UPI00307E808E